MKRHKNASKDLGEVPKELEVIKVRQGKKIRQIIIITEDSKKNQ